MRGVLIRYRLKPEHVERNEELIADRCEEQPVLTKLTGVGSYRAGADYTLKGASHCGSSWGRRRFASAAPSSSRASTQIAASRPKSKVGGPAW